MGLHLGRIFRVHTLGVATEYRRKFKDECGLIHGEFNVFFWIEYGRIMEAKDMWVRLTIGGTANKERKGEYNCDYHKKVQSHHI